jgi:hypothetical protein
MMFNNLVILTAQMRRRSIIRRPVLRRAAFPVASQFGGAGNDVFITNGGTGPVGPPGPPGPPGPAGNPSPVAVTDVATATYTALSTDYFLCVLTNGLVTITLPTGILGTVYIVKDCFGDAANNPITIQGTGGQLVDGSTATINTNFGSLQFVFNGTDWSIV